MVEARNKLTETSVQYIQAYSKDLYQTLFETQAEFSALLQRTWKSYAAAVENWVEQSARVAPVGSAVAVQAIGSTVAATTDAVQQVSEATQQVGARADQTMRIAMNGTIPDNKRRSKQTSNRSNP